jgi:hypothetical protein
MGGEPLLLRLGYRTTRPVAQAEVHVWLCNEQGVNATMLSSRFSGDLLDPLPPSGVFECTIPSVGLAPGRYLLNVQIETGYEHQDVIAGAAVLEVEPGSFFPTGRTPRAEQGLALTQHSWTVRPEEEVANREGPVG